MGKETDIVGLGAVAILAALLYKKGSEWFGSASSSGSSSGSGGSSPSPIVTVIENKAAETGGAIADTAKNTVVSGVISAATGKTNPFFLAGQELGNDFVSWLKGFTSGTESIKVGDGYTENNVIEAADRVKGEKEARTEWESTYNTPLQNSISTAQAGIDALAAGYAAAKSGQAEFTVNGTKYTEVVSAVKSSSGTSVSSSGSSIKRQGGSGTGEDKVRIIKKS